MVRDHGPSISGWTQHPANTLLSSVYYVPGTVLELKVQSRIRLLIFAFLGHRVCYGDKG